MRRRSTSVQSIMSSLVSTAARCSANTRGASRVVEFAAEVAPERARDARCRTCADPSVATVTMTSSRPRPTQLGHLDRGERVADRRQTRDAPTHRRALASTPTRSAGGGGRHRRVEQHVELVGRAVAHGDDRRRCSSRCGSAGCACRRCPGCCARRNRSRASSGTRAPRPRR